MFRFAHKEGSSGRTNRRQTVRSKPQLETLEGRALLTRIHPLGAEPITGIPTIISGPFGPQPSGPPSNGISADTGNVQPFINTVLSNAFARELSIRNKLSALSTFVGTRSGDQNFPAFLDRNQNGVISRSEVSVLARVYQPPYHQLRNS